MEYDREKWDKIKLIKIMRTVKVNIVAGNNLSLCEAKFIADAIFDRAPEWMGEENQDLPGLVDFTTCYEAITIEGSAINNLANAINALNANMRDTQNRLRAIEKKLEAK